MDRKCQDIHAQEQCSLPPCSLTVYPNQVVELVSRGYHLQAARVDDLIADCTLHEAQTKFLFFSLHCILLSSLPTQEAHSCVREHGLLGKRGIRDLETKLEGKDFRVSSRLKQAQNPQARYLICQDDLRQWI